MNITKYTKKERHIGIRRGRNNERKQDIETARTKETQTERKTQIHNERTNYRNKAMHH